MVHIYTMPKKSETPQDVERWLQRAAAALWPAALGSLSFRRSPCIREHCPVCQRGEQHRSHVLYARSRGRRTAVYVPDDLVPQVQRLLDNGRSLQALLQDAAARYVQALKQRQASGTSRSCR